LIYHRFDPSHVDRILTSRPIVAGRDYFRLRLAEMFLAKQVQGARSWYPAVHSVVRCSFGDQLVEIPNIADATRVGALQQSAQGDVVARNFVLVPTMPFAGGTVELSAGLIALQGQNYVESFVKTLGNFASLLNVPQLSTVLSLAQPVAGAMQDLLSGGAGSLHLGLHDAFSSNELQEGYFAVIRAPQHKLAVSNLWVVNDELHEGSGLGVGAHKPYVEEDHLLFRFEIFEERDDWEQLRAIQEPFLEAMDSLAESPEKATFLLRRAQARAIRAPELTRADRTRVVTALGAQFAEAQRAYSGLGLVPADPPTLDRVMRRAMTVDQAIDRGDATFDDILLAPGP
jgi:hypothetical protein